MSKQQEIKNQQNDIKNVAKIEVKEILQDASVKKDDALIPVKILLENNAVIQNDKISKIKKGFFSFLGLGKDKNLISNNSKKDDLNKDIIKKEEKKEEKEKGLMNEKIQASPEASVNINNKELYTNNDNEKISKSQIFQDKNLINKKEVTEENKIITTKEVEVASIINKKEMTKENKVSSILDFDKKIVATEDVKDIEVNKIGIFQKIEEGNLYFYFARSILSVSILITIVSSSFFYAQLDQDNKFLSIFNKENLGLNLVNQKKVFADKDEKLKELRNKMAQLEIENLKEELESVTTKNDLSKEKIDEIKILVKKINAKDLQDGGLIGFTQKIQKDIASLDDENLINNSIKRDEIWKLFVVIRQEVNEKLITEYTNPNKQTIIKISSERINWTDVMSKLEDVTRKGVTGSTFDAPDVLYGTDFAHIVYNSFNGSVKDKSISVTGEIGDPDGFVFTRITKLTEALNDKNSPFERVENRSFSKSEDIKTNGYTSSLNFNINLKDPKKLSVVSK